jgi:hypothetical protein
MIRDMAEIIALPRIRELPQLELPRMLVVYGAAIALIAAGRALPF